MTGANIRIGVLVPLAAPGWVEAGRHLLAGLELGAEEINASGGIDGRRLQLVVRDTAASPAKAAAAVDDLHRVGVAALVGEYHSVAARAAADRAEALRLPFLCSSAVLDDLVEAPTDLIARLAPAQSRGWRSYADFLLRSGHKRVAVASQAGIYWQAGYQVLRRRLELCGGEVAAFDLQCFSLVQLKDALAQQRTTALLLLAGYPEPVAPIVRAVRTDARLAAMMIGAPAGQPEFGSWLRLLGPEGAGIPFLRYLPQELGDVGSRIAVALQERLRERPSFVAFEGYDSILVLAASLRARGPGEGRSIAPWASLSVDATRGRIEFSRPPAGKVWEWLSSPIQVVDRDPLLPQSLRVLYQESLAHDALDHGATADEDSRRD